MRVMMRAANASTMLRSVHGVVMKLAFAMTSFIRLTLLTACRTRTLFCLCLFTSCILATTDHFFCEYTLNRARAHGRVFPRTCPQADPACQRLRGLRKRAPERVTLARVASIVRAGRYGLYEDGMALFKAVDEVGLTDVRHHEAALWSCPTYEDQTELWAVTDRIRGEKGCVMLLNRECLQPLLVSADLITPNKRSHKCHSCMSRYSCVTACMFSYT